MTLKEGFVSLFKLPSHMHTHPGSFRYVIPITIDIQVTMYRESSHYRSPCPADQLIWRVMPVQQYRWSSHSVKTL